MGVMIEAGANQLSEQDTIEAIDLVKLLQNIKISRRVIKRFRNKKIKPSDPEEDKTLSSYLEKNYTKSIELVLKKFDEQKIKEILN